MTKQIFPTRFKEKMSEKDNRDDGRPKNIIEWLTDRHVTVIISGIVMIVIAERLIQGIGGDCVAPAFRNLTKNWRTRDNMTLNERCMWNKVFWHIIEFAIAILGLYLVTKYIFKHRKRGGGTSSNKKLKPGHVRANPNQEFPASGTTSAYFYTLESS
jgi:hypothetical protein